MAEKANIVFMGTPEFAVPALEKVYNEFELKAVVTIPDKPKGRGLKLQASAIKQKALEYGVPILQPEKLKDEEFINQLKSLDADIFVVIAFRILPKEVYEIPKIASFNIHGSLLPKFRGAAPINWAIISGENISGLTSFILKEGVDTGNMLLQRAYPIPEGFTAGDLHDALMPVSADLTIDTIKLLLEGNFKPIPQDESQACPAPKLFRENAQIDWGKSATNVANFINGYSPIPGAWTIFEDKTMKILRAKANPCSCGCHQFSPGDFQISDKEFVIYCGSGYISILELQLEGKKAVKINDFLNGYRANKTGKIK